MSTTYDIRHHTSDGAAERHPRLAARLAAVFRELDMEGYDSPEYERLIDERDELAAKLAK